MNRSKEQLVESRDSWARHTDRERFRSVTSFILANCGGAVTTAGVIVAAQGHLVRGVATTLVGTGLAAFGFSNGINKMDSALECHEKATIAEERIKASDREDIPPKLPQEN